MNVTPEILKEVLLEQYQGRIRESGDEWILPSFENPNKYKLYVNIEKGVGHDFLSNTGYNAKQLLENILEVTDDDLNSIILKYAKHGLSKLVKQKPKYEKEIKQVKTFLPKEAKPIIGNSSFVYKNAKSYLNKRNISDKLIEKYNLLYANGGHYDGRIIIPFKENEGLVWFQGRTTRDIKLRYDNPKGTSKSSLVYNIDAIDKIAIITEGPFDAMMVNGQAIMGSSLSEWQTYKILEKNPQMIILVPDNDYKKHHDGFYSIGYRGALKSIVKLVESGYSLSKIFVAMNSSGKDLNDLGASGSVKLIQNAEKFGLGVYTKFMKMGAENELIFKKI